MDKEIKRIENDLDKLLMDMDAEDEQEDIQTLEKSIQDLNTNFGQIDGRYTRIKEEIEDDKPDNEKPLMNKLKSIQYEMNRCKKKLEAKEKNLESLKRKNKYYDGELEGTERIKAEREIALDNQKKVDSHGLIINSIQENVKAAGTNLQNINTELDSQGQKMDRIHERVLETDDTVKKTSKIMSGMERRSSCSKILAFIAIIVFGLFDVVFGGYVIYKKVAK